MSGRNSNQELAAALIALPDEHLLDVLRQVFEQRRPNAEEDEYNHNRFFLGTASELLGDDGAWEPWEIAAVAYPDPDHYDGGLGPGWSFCQFGTCPQCETQVRSNVKQAICPICSNPAYLT